MIPRCCVCNDMGWKIIEDEKYRFAVFCGCAKGILMRRSHREEIEEAYRKKEAEIEPPLEYPAQWDAAEIKVTEEVKK